jgi:hypothetical protein
MKEGTSSFSVPRLLEFAEALEIPPGNLIDGIARLRPTSPDAG